MRKDTILITGRSAAGKTTIIRQLNKFIDEFAILRYQTALSDSQTIMERVVKDDQQGGFHHTHPWIKPSDKARHTHDSPEKPTVPFTLTDNAIANLMMRDFFKVLALLPHDDGIKFAEWAGGVNTNDIYEPAARVDLSYSTITSLLRQDKLPSFGLERVVAVIHVQTADELRFKLNGRRSPPTEEEVTAGTASFPLEAAAMNIFGTDDFSELAEPFLRNEIGIPFIFELTNDGTETFERDIRNVARQLFFSSGIEYRSTTLTELHPPRSRERI